MDKFLDRLRKIHEQFQKETDLATLIDLQTNALNILLDASEMYQADPSEKNLTAYNQIVDHYNANFHR